MSNLTESNDMSEDASGLRNALEAAKREAAEAAAQAETATRQLAVFGAGVPTTPVGKLFAQSYDGPADTDSIQAAWNALGVGDGAAAPTSHTPTPTEANMAAVVGQGLTQEAPISALTPEQETIHQILSYEGSGDMSGLVAFLESKGMLMDPEQRDEGDLSWLDRAPSPSGVDLGAAANPQGHNPLVVRGG